MKTKLPQGPEGRHTAGSGRIKYLRDLINPPQFLALGFLAMILLGSILLSLPFSWNEGVRVSYLDALFTATSAVCVTGLNVVDTLDTYSPLGQVVVMLLIQFGGLGFMTTAVVTAMLFGKRRITLKDRKVIQEALGPAAVQDLAQVIWRIIRLTLAIELAGALLLALGWVGEFGPRAFYLGLFHAVSAFNNAGFDLMGRFQSLTGFNQNPFILSVIMLLIILGGLGFAVIWEILQYPKRGRLSVNSKIVLASTLILLASGFFGILLLEGNNPSTLGTMSLKGKILNAMFFSVTPRTAGFATLNVGVMSQAGLFLMVLLMAIGASPGSTGGGIKTTTFATIVSARMADIKRRKYPVMFRRKIDMETVSRADTIFVLYITLIAASTMILTVSESTQFMNALLEVVSAAATVGLSTGITPNLTAVGKITIILTMYAGRVGPLTLAFAVSKGGRQLYDYPKEELTLS